MIKKFEERKLLALTFDDGPSKYTEKFVEELHKRNIIVTTISLILSFMYNLLKI